MIENTNYDNKFYNSSNETSSNAHSKLRDKE